MSRRVWPAAAVLAALAVWAWWPASPSASPRERTEEPRTLARPPQIATAAAAASAASGASARAQLPAPPRGHTEVDAVVNALADGWDTRPEPAARPAPERQGPPAARRLEPAAVERAFERMGEDPAWLAKRAQVVKESQRLAKLGVHVAGAECRTGACRFELVFSGRAAERRRAQLARRPLVRSTDRTLVKSAVEPDGTVRTLVYLSRGGSLPHG